MYASITRWVAVGLLGVVALALSACGTSDPVAPSPAFVSGTPGQLIGVNGVVACGATGSGPWLDCQGHPIPAPTHP